MGSILGLDSVGQGTAADIRKAVRDARDGVDSALTKLLCFAAICFLGLVLFLLRDHPALVFVVAVAAMASTVLVLHPNFQAGPLAPAPRGQSARTNAAPGHTPGQAVATVPKAYGGIFMRVDGGEDDTSQRGKYISKIKFQWERSGDAEDIRKGSGGNDVYAVVTERTNDPEDAITSFQWASHSSREPPQIPRYTPINFDLATGFILSWSTYNFLYYAKETGQPPIRKVKFVRFTSAQNASVAVDDDNQEWQMHPQDLLKGGGYKHVYVVWQAGR